MAAALTKTRRPLTASSSPSAAFAPTGQTSANALYGDFLGGTGQSLTKPNVRPGVSTGKTPTASFQTPAKNPFATPSPLQAPGNNMTNPGYGEQALEYTQNRLLEDPYSQAMQNQYQQTQGQQQGEQYMNQNLGTLDGPGQGDQYWNQMAGQYQNPFAGEQFTREATQNFSPTGAAGAFYGQAMGQYGDFTNYSGPQNTQGQYGQSAASLANGTAGEQGLGQIAGQYGQIGQYTDPNLAAGQYAQTQDAFGAMPIANFDPFYDRARQLGVQAYNQGAAGRGVYGSSEALSGVGNVITDIEAQRANRSFDAEMQRAVEQRNRQELLGNQARMGDLSGQGAFTANLKGAETFGNIANMQGNLELGRNELLGNMANMADSQALGAQNANIAGLNAFGTIANNADRAETDRYSASTNAMNQADRTGLDRMNSGADVAFRTDDSARQDYIASNNAANQAAQTGMDRTRLGADIANTASQNDLARLQTFNNNAQGAENQRQNRLTTQQEAQFRQTDQILNSVGASLDDFIDGSQADWENFATAKLAPALQAAGWDQADIDRLIQEAGAVIKAKNGGR